MGRSSLRKTSRRLSSLLAKRQNNKGHPDANLPATALKWAAKRGDASLAEQAILGGAPIDGPDDKRFRLTPLHFAAMGNHPDVIRILLKYGATISARDPDQKTPLHYAAKCKGGEGATVLLELGADMKSKDAYGELPAFRAAKSGGIACMKAFIAAGFDLRTRGSHGETILHAAALSTNEMMKYLLGYEEVKMGIHIRDADRETPLHCAMDPENVRLLLDNGADMHARDIGKNTPAHLAAARNDVPCLRVLIEAGFDLHTKGELERTVLHVAIYRRKAPPVEYLMREGGGAAIVNARDISGLTPLAQALEERHDMRSVIDLLLQNGADLEAKDRYGGRLADKVGKGRCYESDKEDDHVWQYTSDSDEPE